MENMKRDDVYKVLFRMFPNYDDISHIMGDAPVRWQHYALDMLLQSHPELANDIQWCIEHIGFNCCEHMNDEHLGTPFETVCQAINTNIVLWHYHFQIIKWQLEKSHL